MLVILLLVCSFGCAVLAVETPTTTSAAVPLPTTKINPKDGAEMVLVPAGEFLMGSSEEEITAFLKANPSYKREWYANEMPQRKVELDAYYMYKTEVTVAQYRKFCEATKRKMPIDPDWKGQDTHPIVSVTWSDAKAYADWAGVKLPTEAQWEKAARGTEGRIYPWGNKWDSAKCVNYVNSKNGTKPVGSILAGASPYGCLDMAGNSWEWCADWYNLDYYKTAPVKNPIGPDTGTARVLRGGSWNYNDNGYRGAFRFGANPVINDVYYFGFRCASPGP